MMISNILGHLKTITKHKFIVFKLSIKAGIPIRGLLHDLSKYSPTEFIESVRFYQGGKRSPIIKAREVQGYSMAWLHHKAKNKHHFEYWYDDRLKEQPIIPFKYCAEMVCDKLSASIVYLGKDWIQKAELEYWLAHEENSIQINEKIKKFMTEVFTEVSKEGIDKVISKKNLRKIYNKYCNKD